MMLTVALLENIPVKEGDEMRGLRDKVVKTEREKLRWIIRTTGLYM